ncbi:MAG: endonuclease V [Armatimonadota bacterium]|nr:endonuclease V [Armatimonadota bacterium]MDR7428075.1 endonuclease V [Armatimonadota bacterium]MDR7464591.1 endonuclease V [Armatimonadota bacterium]MDR7469677.1 endonuclease V [Armatimonadota bacterium]MDR7475889.1 endonuclease V [Armatimonadota bacterium]
MHATPFEPWPQTPEDLIRLQEELAQAEVPLWRPEETLQTAAGCFVCFPRERTGGGAAGEPGWAAAVLLVAGEVAATEVVHGQAPAPYIPGLLALREGPLLEAAVRRLPQQPQMLIVNATGRDHPRRAGLALHLGARLDLPTVGVTRRPLLAEGDPPPDAAGATSPLRIGAEVVGLWLRTKRGARPLAIHPAWRTDAHTAVEVVMALTTRWRTPEPLRLARRAARLARDRGIRGV